MFWRFWRRDKTVIPVIRLSGVIGASGSPLRRGISFESVDPLLKKAFTMNRAKAVALVINSPGGSPVQSALIGARIRQLSDKHELPVLAFCEDVAASGGYWLAAAANEIYANSASIIGSIGVVSAGFGFPEAIAKLGIERRVYTSGKSKSMLDPFSVEKTEDVAHLKALQAEIHEQFIAYVESRRGGKLDSDRELLFSGAFWTGERALGLGLVDQVGDMYSVLRARFGEKLHLANISPKKRILSFNGAQSKLGDATLLGGSLSQGLATALIDTAEERSHWARFGL